MLGGCIWAFGNILVVPIVKCIGLGLGAKPRRYVARTVATSHDPSCFVDPAHRMATLALAYANRYFDLG